MGHCTSTWCNIALSSSINEVKLPQLFLLSQCILAVITYRRKKVLHAFRGSAAWRAKARIWLDGTILSIFDISESLTCMKIVFLDDGRTWHDTPWIWSRSLAQAQGPRTYASTAWATLTVLPCTPTRSTAVHRGARSPQAAFGSGLHRAENVSWRFTTKRREEPRKGNSSILRIF